MLNAYKLRFQSLELLARSTDVGEQSGSIFAAAFCDTDLLGECVAARLQFLRARLDDLALGFKRFEPRDIERDAAFGEACGNGLKIVPQQSDIEHDGSLAEGLRSAAKCPHRCRP